MRPTGFAPVVFGSRRRTTGQNEGTVRTILRIEQLPRNISRHCRLPRCAHEIVRPPDPWMRIPLFFEDPGRMAVHCRNSAGQLGRTLVSSASCPTVPCRTGSPCVTLLGLRPSSTVPAGHFCFHNPGEPVSHGGAPAYFVAHRVARRLAEGDRPNSGHGPNSDARIRGTGSGGHGQSRQPATHTIVRGTAGGPASRTSDSGA